MRKDKILARDRYGNPVWLMAYPDGQMWDLSTDGRVVLDSTLARALAKNLIKFAESEEQNGKR